MSKSIQFWLSVSMALLPVVAQANTAREQFAVSVNVIAECRVTMPGSSNDAAPGLQGLSATPGFVNLNCSKNTAYQLSFSSASKTDSSKKLASINRLGNGATQIVPIENYMAIRGDDTDKSQPETLVMTIDY